MREAGNNAPSVETTPRAESSSTPLSTVTGLYADSTIMLHDFRAEELKREEDQRLKVSKRRRSVPGSINCGILVLNSFELFFTFV